MPAESGIHVTEPTFTLPVTKPRLLPAVSATCSSVQAEPSSSTPGWRCTDRV